MPMLGEIRMFPFAFSSSVWKPCDGRVQSITTNSALFLVIGNVYGGNGMSTYALPDLRGRAPLHAGQGSGLSPYAVGQHDGSETVTLSQSQIPAHAHQLKAVTDPGDKNTPVADKSSLARLQGGQLYHSVSGPPPGTGEMYAQILTAAGSDKAHNNMQPFVTVNFYICVEGMPPPPG
jgi:microcystin-dependent protein